MHQTRSDVEPAAFREAMARFASGVTIVTAVGDGGEPCGFTASSFCSVSASPPLVLVCLDRAANSYPTFSACQRFAVSILRPSHDQLALRFATKQPDKFRQGGFRATPGGLPAVDGALAVIEAQVHDRVAAGDHVIILGRVDWVETASGRPSVYFDRAFHTV